MRKLKKKSSGKEDDERTRSKFKFFDKTSKEKLTTFGQTTTTTGGKMTVGPTSASSNGPPTTTGPTSAATATMSQHFSDDEGEGEGELVEHINLQNSVRPFKKRFPGDDVINF